MKTKQPWTCIPVGQLLAREGQQLYLSLHPICTPRPQLLLLAILQISRSGACYDLASHSLCDCVLPYGKAMADEILIIS